MTTEAKPAELPRLSLTDPIVSAAAKEIADSMRESKGQSIDAWEVTAALILRRHFQAARGHWTPATSPVQATAEREVDYHLKGTTDG